MTVRSGKSEREVAQDEQPPKANIEKIPALKPAFRDGGTVTAANSSSISDGAAALVLMRRSEAERRGLTPLAAIVGHATHAQAPSQFTTAPIGAVRRLLERTGWTLDEVDLFEINEAFAVVAMAAMRDLGLPHDKVNVHGGACALGHPIGASGARIIVTLLAALEKFGLRRGVAVAVHRRRRGDRGRDRTVVLTDDPDRRADPDPRRRPQFRAGASGPLRGGMGPGAPFPRRGAAGDGRARVPRHAGAGGIRRLGHRRRSPMRWRWRKSPPATGRARRS